MRNDAEMGLPTHYTVRRNTTSIMKNLILILQTVILISILFINAQHFHLYFFRYSNKSVSRTSILSNGRSSNTPIHSPKKVQYLNPNEHTYGTPQLERSSSKSNSKSKNKLSPQFTRKLSFSKSSSLSNVSKREQTASNCSLENVATPRQKKSLFHSFRKRGRKISSIESGLGESVSKSSIDKIGKEDGEARESVNRQMSNARERREAFQHAYTTPERANHSFNRSMDLESFDYKSKKDVYCSNYESEMREVESGKILGQTNLMPSGNYQTPSVTVSNFSSSYITAEQITVPSSTSNQSQAASFPDQVSWTTSAAEGYHNHQMTRQHDQFSTKNANSATSLSMTALCPREADYEEQPARQPVTPAFATYTGPVSAEKLVSGKSTTPRKLSSGQNSLNSDGDNVFEVQKKNLNDNVECTRERVPFFFFFLSKSSGQR